MTTLPPTLALDSWIVSGNTFLSGILVVTHSCVFCEGRIPSAAVMSGPNISHPRNHQHCHTSLLYVQGDLMSEIAEIEHAMSELLTGLQSEGHIDNQFQQLLMLQDDSEPDFVRSVMELFFQDSQNTLQRIHDMVVAPQADFHSLDQAVHELKGSAASFGAHRITNLCIQLRRAVQERQIEQSDMLVKCIADARHTLNEKLSSYIQLENRKKQLSKGI